VESSCELGNEPSGSIKCWESTQWLHNLWSLEWYSAPQSYLKGIIIPCIDSSVGLIHFRLCFLCNAGLGDSSSHVSGESWALPRLITALDGRSRKAVNLSKSRLSHRARIVVD
jgi:hypothetical protein